MMREIRTTPFILKLREIVNEFSQLLKNKYFYIGAGTLFIGAQLNYAGQEFLFNFIQDGNVLPELPDLILDNIPLWDIDYISDIFSVLSLLILITFVIHKRQYKQIPYILLLSGIFQVLRGFFIVLTPIGNPPGFDGTEGLFHGFANIELGVYPSGHIGIAYLYFLFAKDRLYRSLLLITVLIITFSLFVSRGHYTIDILSGMLFAYAIKSFGDKHLLKQLEPAPQPGDPDRSS